MTDQQINVAIAEALGKSIESTWWCPMCGREVSPQMVRFDETHDVCGADLEFHRISDYCNDLNACYKFEEWLIKNDLQMWYKYSQRIAERFGDDPEMIHASSKLRCEAFLSTIGRWSDVTETERTV